MTMEGRHVFDLPDELLKRVPEIAQELEAGIQDWRGSVKTDAKVSYGDDPGCDYVFGSLLVPIVDRLGSALSADARSTLRRLFEYLEELLVDPNENVGAVVKVSFCESVFGGGYPGALAASLELGGRGVKEHLELLRTEYEAARARSFKARFKRWLGIGAAPK